VTGAGLECAGPANRETGAGLGCAPVVLDALESMFGHEREVRMQWLRSATAIKAHLVFLTALAVLTYSVLTGNQGPGGDYPLALVFCGSAYPVVLLLSWVQWRING
jgi:hypothetical protein